MLDSLIVFQKIGIGAEVLRGKNQRLGRRQLGHSVLYSMPYLQELCPPFVSKYSLMGRFQNKQHDFS